MNFTEFSLHQDLLDGIDALNYVTATPIQAQAIPLILQGRDLIGCAQTGTGKTAAFILPIINQILTSSEADYTQCLVIVPTRELAMQIDQVVEAYSYFTGVSSIAVYGGGDGKTFAREKTAIDSGVDIIIATPGRFIAHMNLGYVDLSRTRFLVLDEGDRMLDMGFLPDLNKIIKAVNPNRQTLLFSATMPQQVMKMARTLTKNPATVSISISKPAAGVSQGAYFCYDEQKIALMQHIFSEKGDVRAIVFASTKAAVSQLYRRLRDKKINVEMVSSELEQDEREKVMLDFRNGKVNILVATDVLSRGIDVDDIDLVVNFDCPRDAEDYVHRIGRTGRAERTGAALTLVSPKDGKRFRSIETLIEKQVERLELPDHIKKMEAQQPQQRPEQRRSGGGGHARTNPPRRNEPNVKKIEPQNGEIIKKKRKRGKRKTPSPVLPTAPIA